MSQPLTPEFMLALYLPDWTDLSRYKQIDAIVTPDDTISPFVAKVDIVIEEQNIVPPNIPNWIRVESKWFYEPIKIYDFPLRNKLAKLVVKRRRWINKDTWEYINVPFKPKHPEAFSSQELIDFLK